MMDLTVIVRQLAGHGPSQTVALARRLGETLTRDDADQPPNNL